MYLHRGRELGFQNALTGNVKRYIKHKILQTCDNINVCDEYFNDYTFSYLGTCQVVIRGISFKHYSEDWPHTSESGNGAYMLDIAYEDVICIQIKEFENEELK